MGNSLKISSSMVFRQEFAGSGLLFDADTGKAFMLNSTSIAIWKMLESGMTEEAIEKKIAAHTANPENAKAEISAFFDTLIQMGFLIKE